MPASRRSFIPIDTRSSDVMLGQPSDVYFIQNIWMRIAADTKGMYNGDDGMWRLLYCQCLTDAPVWLCTTDTAMKIFAAELRGARAYNSCRLPQLSIPMMTSAHARSR